MLSIPEVFNRGKEIMPWIQNGVVIVVFFLFARMFVHRRFHIQLVEIARNRSSAGIVVLSKWIMIVAYVMSLFFPNTIVVLACIPVIKDLLDSFRPGPEYRRDATRLALALIYGANIGGMGSITGSALNLVFYGFLEFHRVPGYDKVTFFTWLMIGVPVTLILLGVGLLILGHGRVSGQVVSAGKNPLKVRINPSLRRFAITSGTIALTMTGLSAVQFIFDPAGIVAGLNAVDLAFLILVVMVVGYAFILPHRSLIWSRVWRNTAYLLLNLFLFPTIYLVETFREIRIRISPRKVERTFLERVPDRIAVYAWRNLFGRPLQGGIRAPYKGARVGINGMIYDLPFFGLFFMGMVMLVVFLLVKLGDNPATPRLDGLAVQAMEWLATRLMPHTGGAVMVFAALVFLAIFLTEVVNNTVVVVLLFQVILNGAVGSGGVPSLWAMAAVTLASSAAFMTPVATSVNAVVFAGIRGVSLRSMIARGFLMNLASAGWLVLAFYILSRLTVS